MYSTKIVKAENSSAAVQAIGSSKEGKILAGGMTLIPTMKQRLASPEQLIDIRNIIYFLSLILGALTLNVISINSKKGI